MASMTERMSALEARFRDTIVEVAHDLTDEPLYVAPRPRGLHDLFLAAVGRAPRPPRSPRVPAPRWSN